MSSGWRVNWLWNCFCPVLGWWRSNIVGVGCFCAWVREYSCAALEIVPMASELRLYGEN